MAWGTNCEGVEVAKVQIPNKASAYSSGIKHHGLSASGSAIQNGNHGPRLLEVFKGQVRWGWD